MKVFSSIKKMISIKATNKEAGRISICILIAASIFIASPAWSADYYIAQSAAGSNDATSCANAKAISYLTGSWSGKVRAGDTVHLCGTLTSALTINAGGTSDNARIIILFETGANFTKDAWPTTGAISIADNLSYITIDGGATGTIGGYNGNPSYVNGIIQNTANGTGLANQVNSMGIIGTSVHYLTIKNLAIYNLYVRSGSSDASSGGGGIFIMDEGNGVDHTLITNCLIHDVQNGVGVYFRKAGNTDVDISYITVYNANWGGAIATQSSGTTVANVKVHDNYFHDWTNWDDTANSFHHNGFFMWSEVGTNTNPMYYNNVIGPGYGTHNTSGLFLQYGGIVGATVFNNLFITGSAGPSNGALFIDQTSGTINVYNNTFVSQSTGNSMLIDPAANSTINIKNNVGITTQHTNSSFYANLYVKSGLTWNFDYNMSYGYEYMYQYNTNGSANGVNKAGFQGYIGAGNCVNDAITNPDLNTNYTPKVTSPVVGVGVNLTSLGITALNSDKNGVARPSSGAGDIGAYAYGAYVSTTTKPKAPRNLRITR